MSRVYVLAADKELSGLEPLSYYRQAVEELGYPMRPFRYELLLENKEGDLEYLRHRLEKDFSPGEVVELWSVWLSGDVNKRCPPRFRGRLADFDMEALEQLLSAEEICFDITI
ncbi:MAG: hypothetical protein HFF52_09700 [Lawsonibacter sp.]|nr:hypothetical protein [Lawsonibacter sp.]